VIENYWYDVYLFQENEHQHREVCERLEQEKRELQARLQELLDSERALQLRLDTLQADGDMTQKQMAALQSRLHDLQPNNVIDTKIDIDSFKSTDSTGDFPFSTLQPPKAVGV
jgi:CHAD domain-containing protein